jgi:response regulator RpfG family c-di-GMP phosphodiesterase
MSLRVALVDHPDQHGDLRRLAAQLPREWVVIDDLRPEQVLEDAELGGIDAVFTSPDPGTMDGTALLQRLQRTCPEALRVLVLPAGFDLRRGERLAAEPAVQQVIAAPFEATAVRAAMRRVLTVRSLLRDPALRADLGQVERLPASPSAYLSLRMVVADDSADLEDVVQVLRRDPVLAARVLRVANSALYARGRPILDLGVATQRLGLQTLVQLVLASEVFSRLGDSESHGAQTRALLASTLAMQIAATPRDAGLAGSAALLADLGQQLPGSLLNAPPHPGELWQSAPRVALLGAGLMALWGLPMEMVEAVAFHHAPGRLPGRGLDVVGATHIARALVGDLPLDEAWVASAGLAPHLPAWRERAERLQADVA